MHSYKDDTYENTIEKIKKILCENNISVNVKITSGVKGIYAAYLSMENTPFYTNGKGISENQAVAGAYGELMERLQNRAFFRFYNTFVLEENNANLYFPMEVEKEICYVIDNKGYLGARFDALPREAAAALIKDSLRICSDREKESSKFLCVPYELYNGQKVIFLPVDLVKHIYASNGMCAGNTKQEALVEGICEVFERYVNRVLLEGEITPPDIPEDILRKKDCVYEFIKEIQKSGDYNVVFKDCSLGKGLPVVGLIIFDKKNGKYFVKFGAHPDLEVALCRTIMEMFQGRKISMSSFWFKEFELYKDCNYQENFRKIFRSGDGEYPTKIFEKKYSYEYDKKWENVIEKDNGKILQKVVDIIKKNNWNLLYTDLSYMGFPTYHVIIPQISEILKLNKNFIDNYEERLWVNSSLRRLAQINEEQILRCVRFLENCNYSYEMKISDFLGLTIGDKRFDNYRIGDIILFYYLAKDSFEECIAVLDKIVDSISKVSSRVYYKCIKNYIKSVYLLKKGKKQTKDLLYMSYTSDLVNQVIILIENRKKIFESFPVLKCGNCDDCAYVESCLMSHSYKLNKQIIEGWQE